MEAKGEGGFSDFLLQESAWLERLWRDVITSFWTSGLVFKMPLGMPVALLPIPLPADVLPVGLKMMAPVWEMQSGPLAN